MADARRASGKLGSAPRGARHRAGRRGGGGALRRARPRAGKHEVRYDGGDVQELTLRHEAVLWPDLPRNAAWPAAGAGALGEVRAAPAGPGAPGLGSAGA